MRLKTGKSGRIANQNKICHIRVEFRGNLVAKKSTILGFINRKQ